MLTPMITLLAVSLCTATPQHVVDMSEVIDVDITETGILFHFSDGTGYYLEF